MQTSKWKKRIAGILSFMVFLAGTNAGLNYLLVEHTFDDDYALEVAQLKTSGQNPEIVFLGNDKILHGIDPEAVESRFLIGSASPAGSKENKEIALNAAFKGQTVYDSYVILSDLLSRGFDPKYVVIGVDAELLCSEITYSRSRNQALCDRLGLNALSDFSDASADNVDIFSVASKIYRYRENLSAEKIRQVVSEKKARRTAESDGRPYIKDGDFYAGKGYVASTQKLTDRVSSGSLDSPVITNFNVSAIIEENKTLLDKTIGLCFENNIQVFLIAMPVSKYVFERMQSPEAENSWWEDYALLYGIKYFNYNFIENKDELFPDSQFSDYYCLNDEGAAALSDICARKIKENTWAY